MQRRGFLKTIVLGAAAATTLGCGSDGQGDGGGEVDDGLGGRTAGDGARYFPQSIASGDPRPESVVLWARLEDGEVAGDLLVALQVALDEGFTMLVDLPQASALRALAIHDGCVRVRVEGLTPATSYYYRFAYLKGDNAWLSRTGKTKTAPKRGADVNVCFAVASCQDYVGRYFHGYKHMAEQELDFFVHLGDYVYETTGDPSFQDTMGERALRFEKLADALELSQDDVTFYAASSLANYRDLYKTYRSDPDIQKIHERLPMIAVWDDHEFSDDCHGQTATYFAGSQNEEEPARRAHADQAWFEFMPIDYVEPTVELVQKGVPFPDNFAIYRDFEFGKHLHLVMTDLRRYRDDHLVPEDAFPGAVAASQGELEAALGAVPEIATAYVDLEGAEHGELKAFLNEHATELGFVEGDFAGRVGVDFINAQLAAITASTKPADLDGSAEPRGLVYAQLFKTGRYSQIGSRYAVVAEPFDLLARVVWHKSKGRAQEILGPDQEDWFIETIRASKQTWKIWGNEYTLMDRRVDLREVGAAAVLGLQTVLYPSVEDWQGAPDRREKLLSAIGAIPNVVAVTGDIHAFFSGVVESSEHEDRGLIEFVAGAISSTTYKDLLRATTAAISPFAVALAEAAEDLLTAANPHMAYLQLERNGYGVFEAGAEQLSVSYFHIASDALNQKKLSGSPSKAFESVSFHVPSGTRQLRRKTGGKVERWDPAAGKWVGV